MHFYGSSTGLRLTDGAWLPGSRRTAHSNLGSVDEVDSDMLTSWSWSVTSWPQNGIASRAT